TAPDTLAWDLVPHTRTFSPNQCIACRLADLPGMRGLFGEVEGLDQLDIEVALATQFHETDLAFLRRMAWLSGKQLSCRHDKVATAAANGSARRLPGEAVLRDSVSWKWVMEPAVSECLAWNVGSGRMPADPVTVDLPGDGTTATGIRT